MVAIPKWIAGTNSATFMNAIATAAMKSTVDAPVRSTMRNILAHINGANPLSKFSQGVAWKNRCRISASDIGDFQTYATSDA